MSTPTETAPVAAVIPVPEETSKSPKRKVVGATVGAGLSVPTADFANYVISQMWFSGGDVPSAVSVFAAAVVTTGFTLFGGYVIKSAPGE